MSSTTRVEDWGLALGPALDGLVEKSNYRSTQYLTTPLPRPSRWPTCCIVKCDLVICLSHLGWLEEGVGITLLIRSTRGIDLVLGGHNRTFFTKLRYVKTSMVRIFP